MIESSWYKEHGHEYMFAQEAIDILQGLRRRTLLETLGEAAILQNELNDLEDQVKSGMIDENNERYVELKLHPLFRDKNTFLRQKNKSLDDNFYFHLIVSFAFSIPIFIFFLFLVYALTATIEYE